MTNPDSNSESQLKWFPAIIQGNPVLVAPVPQHKRPAANVPDNMFLSHIKSSSMDLNTPASIHEKPITNLWGYMLSREPILPTPTYLSKEDGNDLWEAITTKNNIIDLTGYFANKELPLECWICDKTFQPDEIVFSIEVGKISNKGELELITEEKQVICEEHMINIDSVLRKMRREHQDEKDGGEQRALDAMENAICRCEKGESPFAGHPDAYHD